MKAEFTNLLQCTKYGFTCQEKNFKSRFKIQQNFLNRLFSRVTVCVDNFSKKGENVDKV